MKVLNVRIDDRLVHGVVATNWIPRLNVDRVVVLDEESANNPVLKSALRMATPKNVRLSVISVEKFLENHKENKYGQEKIMIVVKSLVPILALTDALFPIAEITIGNLGKQKADGDAVVISKYIAVNEEIKEQVESLHTRGIQMYAQLIPENDALDFYTLMHQKI